MSIIGIDLDGVLADTSRLTIKIWNEAHPKKKINYSDWCRWDFYNELNISKRELFDLMNLAWECYISMKPVEDNIPSNINLLKNAGHIISIVTTRDLCTSQFVCAWLTKHEILHDSLVIIDKGPGKFLYPIDILIDDNPMLIGNVPFHKHLYLRTQPWNEKVEVTQKQITRVSSFADAVNHILSK